jgi:high-affinity Fe2+/Pb2+ permease
MWKKAIPNVLYSVGIFLCIIIGYEYGIEQKQYGILFGAVVLIAIFIFLKIKILKEIKNTLKKP